MVSQAITEPSNTQPYRCKIQMPRPEPTFGLVIIRSIPAAVSRSTGNI